MKKPTKESEILEFQEDGGILQPIRAIVMKNPDIEKVATTSINIFNTLELLSSNDPKINKLIVADQWASCINKSNIVGYFAANKDEYNDVYISYSFCKPEDWYRFNPVIGKYIAINKNSIVAAVVRDTKPNQTVIPKLKHRKLTYIGFNGPGFYGRRKTNFTVYAMLGTFEDQLEYFIKRVRKYYNFDK